MSRISYKDTLKSSGSPNRITTNNTIDRKKQFPRSTSLKSRIDRDPSAHNTPNNTVTATNSTNTASGTRMSSPTPTCETSALLRQNQELRQRLQDESNNYRRRIDTYKQAQQNQAALVSRLQAKILQYKQRYNDLEGKIHETVNPITSTNTPGHAGPSTSMGTGPCTSSTIPIPLPPNISSLSHVPCTSTIETHPPPCRDYSHYDNHDDICRKLEEEKNRCEQLMTQNTTLRQQLEESNRTNEALTNDLQKLTNDWANLRDEMLAKEDEFKEEEQAFNDYYHSEHNRLLKMWHEVVSVKRAFKEMQSAMKSDIGRMRMEICGANREANSACNSVLIHLKQADRVGEQQQMNAERECNDLKNQLVSLKQQFENARQEINQRDIRLQDLMQQIKILEDRCAQAESQAIQATRLSDEIERLNAALRDIAHSVVQDAEAAGSGGTNSDEPTASQHLHLSQSRITAPPKSPRRASSRTSQAFVEGTISAVQATLHKYQLTLHDFQVKLQSNSEIIQNTRRQLESSEHTKEILTSQVTQLTEKLDSTNSQLSELCKERDSLQKTLDNIRNEKENVEKGRVELNTIVDNLSSDYEKLQIANGKLQKYVDNLEEDKKALELEVQKILKDKDIMEMNLRAEVDHGSKMREEIINLREEINKLYLSKDLLEQQRLETENLISMLEKQKSELEFDLDKILFEKSELQNRLDKLSTSNDTILEELEQFKNNLIETENERNKYKCQVNDQAADIASLKKELISAEQIRLDLESDKLNLTEKLKCLELEKEKIEQELSCIARDRSDCHNQLTAVNRKKEAINEELMRMRQRLEQSNETNNRINRSLEDLVKENEERQVIIESHEKEIQRFQELLASLRSEKESLEAVLFDTNTTLEATEEKRNQLEREVQDLLVKEENLKNQVARLTKDLEACNRRTQEIKTQSLNAARAQEAEYSQKLSNIKNQSDEIIKKLNEEKEAIRTSLEKKMHQALQTLQMAKDEEIEKQQERLEALQRELENTCQKYDETLIRAENEKQQALLIAHRDRKAVAEKLEIITRELKVEKENLERNRRESAAKTDKDRNLIGQLREELAQIKMKGEELRTQLEEEVKGLEIQLTSLKEERDGHSRLADELKTEVRLKEDRIESLNNQYQDTMRKLKEAENNIDSMRRELTDTRRVLADCNIEKNKYVDSNKELREHVMRVESSKRDQSRAIEEALQKIASLEETRNNLENEKTRLVTLLNETENNLAKTTQELNLTKNNLQKAQVEGAQRDSVEKELQARLNNEVEERERIQQELNQTKKQLSDLEVNLCNTRQELGRTRCHAGQEESRWHNREQELLKCVEEGRCREKRLEDQKHNLEVCLADATQQIRELKAQLNATKTRINTLDEQLATTEAYKKDSENKLCSIVHALRRIAGIQFDGTVNLSYRLLSPSRRYSPVRGSCSHDFDTRSVSGCQEAYVDIDPELIRKGIRNLMHQVAQIERDKEDYKMQLCTAKKQLQDAAEQQKRCDANVAKLQQIIRNLEEKKCNLEAELKIKISTLNSIEQAFKQKSEEATLLQEKISSLEAHIVTEMEEKGQTEERLEKCRQHCNRLEQEKRQLQDELARVEARASKLDIQRVSLEGDITRLQMALAEKENAIQTLQERLDNQSRTCTQLEDSCMSLKSTVDQLNDRLRKADLLETELRGEINALHKQRSEQGHCMQANEDKLKQLKKTLSNIENEKRILQERLDAALNNINELRRNQQAQEDSIQHLREQVADLEVQKSSLESQLRIAKWNQENIEHSTISQGGGDGDLSKQLMKAEREKSELQRKLEALKDKMKQLENERQRKYSGKVTYGGEVDSNRLETESYSYRPTGSTLNCGLDHAKIEQENRDLRIKVRRLETLLAEKEAELARAKAHLLESPKCLTGDSERYRNAQIQAEKLIDAREQAHRQQITRLENQISMLREQLAQEAKRRQRYILQSSRANREMQQLRNTLGDSLRHVSQDPLDPTLLESETRRLDTAVSMSLPPSSCHDYDH